MSLFNRKHPYIKSAMILSLALCPLISQATQADASDIDGDGIPNEQDLFNNLNSTFNTPDLPLSNFVDDYGLINDDAATNQSLIIQAAIDEVSAQGGGRISLPLGKYMFAGIYMKSNVHIEIAAGTVIKPYWPDGTKTAVFAFNADFTAFKKDPKSYIENVSIRGIGGRFTIDYHDRIRNSGEGIRAIVFSMVKNFYVADVDIKDNYSTYCGMTFSPSKSDNLDVSDWEVSRPTLGTVRNSRIFKASPGYGLAQFHGAQSLYFEDVFAVGGVTMRFETGALSEHIGVFDVTGKNITNKDGRAAVMFGPHSGKNGVVKMEDITSISSTYAVTIGMGGVKEGDTDGTPGHFSEGTSVKNIHAIFGTQAQLKKHALLALPEEYYESLKLWPDNKFYDSPSIGAVKDESVTYDVIIENVTMDGFKYYNNKPILTDSDEREGKWGNVFEQWQLDYPGDEFKTDKATVVEDYDINDLLGPHYMDPTKPDFDKDGIPDDIDSDDDNDGVLDIDDAYPLDSSKSTVASTPTVPSTPSDSTIPSDPAEPAKEDAKTSSGGSINGIVLFLLASLCWRRKIKNN